MNNRETIEEWLKGILIAAMTTRACGTLEININDGVPVRNRAFFRTEASRYFGANSRYFGAKKEEVKNKLTDSKNDAT